MAKSVKSTSQKNSKKSESEAWKILRALLKPPGDGIYAVSAGKGAAFELQEKHFFASQGIRDLKPTQITELWWSEVETHLSRARVVMIGAPSDTGAGIRRGAAYGPRAIRSALLDRTEYRGSLRSGMLLDLGDLFVNPHLLHDSMLSSKQIRASQKAMYGGKKYPVSPLSQLTEVLKCIHYINPEARIFLLGGDHSVAWPLAEHLIKKYKKTIIQQQ
jgi:agmatinase